MTNQWRCALFALTWTGETLRQRWIVGYWTGCHTGGVIQETRLALDTGSLVANAFLAAKTLQTGAIDTHVAIWTDDKTLMVVEVVGCLTGSTVVEEYLACLAHTITWNTLCSIADGVVGTDSQALFLVVAVGRSAILAFC